MTLQDIHKQIKQAIPEAGVVSVTHEYINNGCQEHWSAMVYAATENKDNTLDNVICTASSSGADPSQLIINTLKAYSAYLRGKVTQLQILEGGE